MKVVKGYAVADEGNIFVCTEFGYQRSIEKNIKGRAVGKPVPHIYAPTKVPVLWVQKGYVEEVKAATNLEDIVDIDSQTAANNEAMRKVIAFMVGGAEDGK